MRMLHDGTLSAVDMNLLVVLRALLAERHVTRAAARVGLSQSATSHALARLRDLYGDPLLVRSGRELELTPRAQRLLPTLERGLSDLKAALAGEPGFEPATARRAFTLGLVDYLQTILLGPLLRTLEREAPNIDLTLVNVPNLEEEAMAGSLDLAVTLSSKQPTLVTQELFDDGFVCLLRRGHPAAGPKLSMQTYLTLRHVVVAPSGTSGSLVDTELERRGLSRRVALRISNFLVAPLVVRDTDFISTMPTRLALRLAAPYGLRVMPAPLELRRFGMAMMWHPRLEHDPAQVWLRGLVARVSREIAGEGVRATPPARTPARPARRIGRVPRARRRASRS
jgi:DNA-binding transcriptional LysR family regulator